MSSEKKYINPEFQNFFENNFKGKVKQYKAKQSKAN